MPTLTVKGLDKREWGSSIVRLHQSHRNGIGRYGLARITNKKNSNKYSDAVLLGHNNEENIYMAYDARQVLGVKKGDELDFELRKLGWCKKVRWYLSTPDPRIYIPAWLAVWSVVIGVVGVIFGIVSQFN